MPNMIKAIDKRYILVLLIVAISGCINENVDSSTNTNQTIIQIPTATQGFPVREQLTVYVEIRGSMFIPRELNIVSGTTVKWTNADSASYIVNVDGELSPTLNKRDSWNHNS